MLNLVAEMKAWRGLVAVKMLVLLLMSTSSVFAQPPKMTPDNYRSLIATQSVGPQELGSAVKKASDEAGRCNAAIGRVRRILGWGEGLTPLPADQVTPFLPLIGNELMLMRDCLRAYNTAMEAVSSVLANGYDPGKP